MNSYDVIVAGLGAMGSAALFQLAKSGTSVLGIDRFDPPHERGSTHGETRLTRQSVCEGEEYVPLVLRSNEIWRELERSTGRSLLRQTGGLIFTSGEDTSLLHGSDMLEDTIRIARKFGIGHETLGYEDLRRRFPGMHFEPGSRGYFETGSGYLLPELCVRTNLELAAWHGAEVRRNESILAIGAETGGAVTVTTEQEVYGCGRLILSTGAWVKKLLGDVPEAERFSVFRQSMFWFRTRDDYSEDHFPVFIKGGSDENSSYYGFPSIGGSRTIKIGIEQFGATSDPDNVDRSVSDSEVRKAYEMASANFDIEPYPEEVRTCLYTVTEGFRFVIDFLPGLGNVLVVSPCSGHGFKHSAGIGLLARQMVLGEEPFADVSRFRFKES